MITVEKFNELWDEMDKELFSKLSDNKYIEPFYWSIMKVFKNPSKLGEENALSGWFKRWMFLGQTRHIGVDVSVLINSMLGCLCVYAEMRNISLQEAYNIFREQSKKVLVEKAKEYSRENNRLLNFEMATKYFGIYRPTNAIYSFVVKHFVSVDTIIYDYNNGIKTSDEMLREKFGDIYNYAILMYAALKNYKNYE